MQITQSDNLEKRATSNYPIWKLLARSEKLLDRVMALKSGLLTPEVSKKLV